MNAPLFFVAVLTAMDRSPEGRWALGAQQPQRGWLMLWGGKGGQCWLSTPAGMWAADVSILGKVKCLLTGVSGSHESSAEPGPAIALDRQSSTALGNHGTALALLALPLHG